MIRTTVFLAVLCAASAASATPCEKLAVDSKHLYFIDGLDLFIAPRAGGPSVLLVERAVPYDGGCLVADGTRLLYVSGSEIRAVSPSGGTPVTVAKVGAPIVDMSVDGRQGTDLFVATETEIHAVTAGKSRVLARSKSGIDALVTDTTTVYWADRDGTIRAIAKTGGSSTTVTGGLDHVTDLALDDAGFLYYLADQALWRASKTASVKRGQKLASRLFLSQGIQVDAKRVYVVTDRGMVTVPRTGGAASRITSESIMAGIIDGGHVLWDDGNEVQRTPVTGGKAVRVASSLARQATPVATQKVAPLWLANKQGMPQEIALSPDGSMVFFVNAGNLSGDGPRVDWTLSSVAAAGGKPQVIHTGFADIVTADATHVFFVAHEAIWSLPHAGGKPTQLTKTSVAGDMILGLAIDTDHVYWSENRAGLVRKVSKQGGAATTLATKQSAPVRVVVDDAFVYWYETATIKNLVDVPPPEIIQRVAKQGGIPQAIVKSGFAHEIALGTDRIYWIANHGRLMTALKDGTNARPLAVLTGAPQSLAVAADGIYITDSVDGAIRRVTANGVVTIVHEGHRTWGVAAVNKVVVWTDMGRVFGTGSVARLP